MAATRPGHRPDVEGLRAVAVILVVLNHLIAVPAGGFIGVDLFFVISGFVITGMLWRETSERSFSFRRFYWRRVRRLMPAALLVLLVTNLAAQYFFLGPRVEQTRTDTWWALAFLANVHMAKTDTDYFHANDAPSLLQHYWSLAVEEQFYFVWPVLLFVLAVLARKKLGKAVVLPVTLLATGASFMFALRLVAEDPAQAYFSAPARAWELGAGAVLGLLVAWGLRVPGWLQHSFGWMGVGLVVVACAFIDPSKPFPGASALVPVGAAVALILAGTGTAVPRVTKVLRWPVSRYIGRISYPVYLWHWPVIVISSEVWGRNAVVWVAAPFVSVVLAVLTHHLLEDPLRGRVHPKAAYAELVPMMRGNGFVKWAPLKNMAIGATAYVLVLTSIAVIRVPTVDLPIVASSAGSSATQRVTADSSKLSPELRPLREAIEASLSATEWPKNLRPSLGSLEQAGAQEWIQDGCLDVTADKAPQCLFGSPNATHHAAILGDSIAISYLPALRAALKDSSWDFQVLTMPICNNAVPVLHDGKPYTECDAHRAWAIKEALRMRPDLIVLANVTNIDNIDKNKIATNPLLAWEQGLSRTLSELTVATRNILVLSPPPGSGNLQTCATRRAKPLDCMSRVSAAWDRVALAEERASLRNRAHFVRTDQWFCSFGDCPAIVGRTPVYFDGIHLTREFALRLAPLVREALTPLLQRNKQFQ